MRFIPILKLHPANDGRGGDSFKKRISFGAMGFYRHLCLMLIKLFKIT